MRTVETSGVCAVVPAGQAGFRPRVLGMGLLTADREVVTCAHVVDLALGVGWQRDGRPARLRICFPFHDRALCLDGYVDPDRWFPPGRSLDGEPADVAVIRLDEPAPVEVGRMRWGPYRPGAAVQVYGFRGTALADGSWRSHPDGEWAFGKVVGPQPGGRAQFDGQRTTGARITGGFSGGAVYDPEQRAAVGMIVEADRNADSRIAQFIDAASLRQALGEGQAAAPSPPGTLFDSSLPHQSERLFVGRVGLQDLLLEHTTGERQLPPVHLVGHGGIGKTALLRQMLDRVPGSVYVDVAFIRSPLDLLRRLVTELLPQRIGFPNYLRESGRYADLERGLLLRPDLNRQAILFLSKLADLQPTGDGGEIGSASRLTQGEAPGAAQTMPIFEALSPADRELFVNPLPRMTRAFAADLGAAGYRLCLALDRTERAPAHLGEWLWREVLPECPGVRLMTAGRDDISQAWRLSPGRVRVRELGPLSEAEGARMISRIGITDPASQDRILASAGGIPLAIELAAESIAWASAEPPVSNGAVDAFVVDRMVKVFMEELAGPERRLLQHLAIFRRFNRETLNELRLGSEQTIDAMLAIRFVKHVEHGYALHDSVRDFILRDLRRQEPSTYRTLHVRAADHYRNQPGPFTEGGPRFLEWLYHTLSANGPDGFDQLRRYFTVAALAIRPDFCGAVIRVARESDVDGELPQLWLRFFEGAVSRQRFDFADCVAIYEEILRDADIELDQELKAELLYQHSVALWYLCRFEEAERVARASMDLNRTLGKNHFYNRSQGVIGLALDRMGRFPAAIRQVRQLARRAATSDPVSEAYALNSVGYFSWHAGDWRGSESALLACRERWIALKNPLGECYPLGHLGLLYTGVRQYGLAWELLQRSEHLSQVSGNPEMTSVTLQNLSAYHRRTGDFPASVACGEEAVEVSRRLKHPYFQADSLRCLGETYLALGEVDRARQAVDAGLAEMTGSQAIYLQTRLTALGLAVRVEECLTAGGGTGDQERLHDELRALTTSCVDNGFLNTAADTVFSTLRLVRPGRAIPGDADLVTLFAQGADLAFAYNWYVGMDYLERVRQLGDARLDSALDAAYGPDRLRELHDSRTARTLKSFHAAELDRVARFCGPP